MAMPDFTMRQLLEAGVCRRDVVAVSGPRCCELVAALLGVMTCGAAILPLGTAFMSDVGMSGDYNSVIGMDKEEPMMRFLRKISGARFEPAGGPATLCALAVETDDATGLARRIAAVRLGGRLEEARPTFWE